VWAPLDTDDCIRAMPPFDVVEFLEARRAAQEAEDAKTMENFSVAGFLEERRAAQEEARRADEAAARSPADEEFAGKAGLFAALSNEPRGEPAEKRSTG